MGASGMGVSFVCAFWRLSETLARGGGLRQACRERKPSLKPQATATWEPLVTAILIILAFLVVIGALNLYEFGRLD